MGHNLKTKWQTVLQTVLITILLISIGLLLWNPGNCGDGGRNKVQAPEGADTPITPRVGDDASTTLQSPVQNINHPDKTSQRRAVETSDVASVHSASQTTEGLCELPSTTLTVGGRSKTTRTDWGLEITHLGGGEMRRGSGQGDVGFASLRFRFRGEQRVIRRRSDEWHRLASFAGLCWRGVGVGPWMNRAVKIRIKPRCDSEKRQVESCRLAFHSF